ncbi:uncharacterized protein LOC131945036 [Physella acuta]|uniref:uncharacterized protein LOC131945036 n=1 Tax=Physella acuta TaxID=109671 RepID=UPI0027DB657B|nr:uncharacterized protein LOC131945036 [Physella acuta]
MFPYIPLRTILFLTILFHLVNGRENIMSISSKVISFDDSYFLKFFDCISNKHFECYVYFKNDQTFGTKESVYNVESTSSKSIASATSVYTCMLNNDSFLALDYVKCILGDGYKCLDLSSKSDSRKVAILWSSIYDYLDSGLIKNSISKCSTYLNLILYWKTAPDRSYVPDHEEIHTEIPRNTFFVQPTFRVPSLKESITLKPLPEPTTSTNTNYKVIGSLIAVPSAIILMVVIFCLRYRRAMNSSSVIVSRRVEVSRVSVLDQNRNILRQIEFLQNDGRSARRENRRNNKHGRRVDTDKTNDCVYRSENKDSDHFLAVNGVKGKKVGSCNDAASFQDECEAGQSITANVTGYLQAGGIRSMDTREETSKHVGTKKIGLFNGRGV